MKVDELDMLILARWTFWRAGQQIGDMQKPFSKQWVGKDR